MINAENLVKQDLNTPNKTNTELLNTYLCGFTEGLDTYDKVSS